MIYLGPEYIFDACNNLGEYALTMQIEELATVSGDIILSPENKDSKRNELTGLRLKTWGDDAYLYPSLVPDNGCGFCLGLIKNMPDNFSQWSYLAEKLSQYGGIYSSYRRDVQPDDILGSLLSGNRIISSETCSKIKGQNFYRLLGEDLEFEILLKQPYGCFLGHFLEIRKIIPVDDEAPGGFLLIIHSGAQGIHRWMQRKINEIYHCDTRFYGAPLHTQEGQDRVAAMWLSLNYAIQSRALALEIVRYVLHTYFQFDIECLSDIVHSYMQFTEDGIIHSRGIQQFSCPYNSFSSPYCLLAGTKNTASYLLRRVSNDGIICHGTPETLHFVPECEPMEYSDTLKWSDTDKRTMEPALIERITYDMARYYEEANVAKISAKLHPVFNMQKADKASFR